MRARSFKLKILAASLLILLPITYPLSTVSAHGLGLYPFFLVNGKLAPIYPATQSKISPSPTLPQDAGPENYLVNQPIKFEIDTSKLLLIIPQSVLDKTTYKWDFGDGTSGSDTKNNHTYSKMGSYVLSVIADYHQPEVQTQLIETIMLNVLPDKNYKLPQAVIKVNGKLIHDALKDEVTTDLNNWLSFDATSSQPGSSQIVKYMWDFDDGTTSSKAFVYHHYRLPQYLIFPILRVKDSHGFISDAAVGVRNSGNNTPNNVDPNDDRGPGFLTEHNEIIWLSLALLAVASIFLVKYRRGKSSE